MEAILNFDQNLDIGLFDRVVNTLFTGAGEEVCIAALVIMVINAFLSNREPRRL